MALSTTPLRYGASSFTTLSSRKSSGRQRCWQWGRPPKQVRKYFLKKTQIPCSRACYACLSGVARCAAEQGRHVRALRPGGGAGVGEPEEEDNVASVARGAPQAYYGRCGRAICHARGGLELVLIHRNPVCCCRRAWQACAAACLPREHWQYCTRLERQACRSARKPQTIAPASVSPPTLLCTWRWHQTFLACGMLLRTV